MLVTIATMNHQPDDHEVIGVFLSIPEAVEALKYHRTPWQVDLLTMPVGRVTDEGTVCTLEEARK